MPNGILAIIFDEYLDKVSSLCLSLACKSFWEFHKAFFDYPHHISFLSYSFREGKRIQLWQLLSKWMGDRKFYIMPSIYREVFMTPQLHKAWISRISDTYGPQGTRGYYFVLDYYRGWLLRSTDIS
jgi:hypothetical protein